MGIQIANDRKMFNKKRPYLSVKRHFFKQIYPNIARYRNITKDRALKFKIGVLGRFPIPGAGEQHDAKKPGLGGKDIFKSQSNVIEKPCINNEVLSTKKVDERRSNSTDNKCTECSKNEIIFENYDEDEIAMEKVLRAIERDIHS